MAAEEEGVSRWMDGTVESTETEQGLSFNRIDPEQALRLRSQKMIKILFHHHGIQKQVKRKP